MTVSVTDAHAHVQRLLSIVKMATLLEGVLTLHYITFHGSKVSQNGCRMWDMSYNYKNEEQRSLVRFFCGRNNSLQRIFTKKYFLFAVGSVYRVKRFTIRSRNVAIVSLTTKRLKWKCGVAVTTVETYWQSNGTSLSMLVEDMSRNKYFSKFEYHIVACRLKAGISETERTSISRQRLGTHFSFIIVWVTIKHVHVATRT
jgi:hypothetical protein